MKYFTSNSIEMMVSLLAEISDLQVDMLDDSAVFLSAADTSAVGRTDPVLERMFASDLTELYDTASGDDPAERTAYYTAITHNNQRIGAFRLVGPLHKIEACTKVIRTVSTLLIEEHFYNERERLKASSIAMIVDEWFHLTPESDCSDFRERAKITGINLKLPRVIVQMHIHNLQRLSSDADGAKQTNIGRLSDLLFQLILDHIDREGNDFCVSAGNDFVLLLAVSDVRQARKQVEQLKHTIERRYAVSVFSGFSPVMTDFRTVGAGYRYAQLATRVARSQNKPFAFYDDLSMELLLSNVDPRVKQDYVNKVYKGCTPAEIREWTNLLAVYFKCNGSLNETAKQLYLHKNTLQYKLSKICERTGFDPRNRIDCVTLYLANYIILEYDPGVS